MSQLNDLTVTGTSNFIGDVTARIIRADKIYNVGIVGNYENINVTGEYSCGGGYEINNNNRCCTTLGKFNNIKTMNDLSYLDDINGTAFTIGCGINTITRDNCTRIEFDGSTYSGKYNTSGADYAEFLYEWHDGNPDNEDRVGLFVTVKNQKLYIANEGDYICGIISGHPAIVGNSDEDYLHKYEVDEFNRPIYIIENREEEKEVEIEEIIENYTNPDTGETFNITIPKKVMQKTGKIIPVKQRKISENYNSNLPYIERKYRPEWDYVGMIGVLPTRDDGTCVVDGWCKCGKNGIATKTDIRDFDSFRVIERVNDKVIKVLLK